MHPGKVTIYQGFPAKRTPLPPPSPVSLGNRTSLMDHPIFLTTFFQVMHFSHSRDAKYWELASDFRDIVQHQLAKNQYFGLFRLKGKRPFQSVNKSCISLRMHTKFDE